jgi:hypothetical protein
MYLMLGFGAMIGWFSAILMVSDKLQRLQDLEQELLDLKSKKRKPKKES